MRLVIGNKVYSSWSLRPWIVMRAKGIPFEEEVVPLRQPDSAARLQALSPSGKVPCLIDGDIVVWETLAILEYLAGKFPDHGIWPRDTAARAHARAVSAEMHAGFAALRGECQMTVTKRYAARQRSAATMADAARITAIWRQARDRFGGRATGADAGPFLYGAFSAADGMFAPVVTRFHTYSFALDPVSDAYAAAVRAHPAFRDWLAGAIAEPWVIGDNDEPVIEDLRAGKS